MTSILLVLTLVGRCLALHTSTAPQHDVHASYARMAIDGNKAYLSIRLFSDDLTTALQQFHKNPNLPLNNEEASLQAFQKYLNWKFILKRNGKQVSAKILEMHQDQMATTYVAQYEAMGALNKFSLRNVVLMELFKDQRNVFKAIKLPSDIEQSHFFGAGVTELEISL